MGSLFFFCWAPPTHHPLAGQLINHGHGLLDIAMASYNYFVEEELPRMVNELRPIVWVEKQDNVWLSINIQTHFTCVEKPMLNPSQIILPLQAQQLGRSYTGRLLVHVEVRTVAADATKRSWCGSVSSKRWQARSCSSSLPISTNRPAVTHPARRAPNLCIGDVPVLVGSCLCHNPTGSLSSYFIVIVGCCGYTHPMPSPNCQCKMIVSQERLIKNHPLVSICFGGWVPAGHHPVSAPYPSIRPSGAVQL